MQPAQPRPLSPRPRRGAARALLIFGLLLAAAVVALVVVDAGRRTAPLYVVNPFDVELRVEIAGLAPVVVEPGGWTELELGAGSHEARLAGPVEGSEELVVERAFPARLWSPPRALVLNPGGAAILVRETAVYSDTVVRAGDGPSYELSYGDPVWTLDPVDLAFEPFPAADEAASADALARLDVYAGDVAPLVGGLVTKGRGDEALSLAEWAMQARPARRKPLLEAYTAGARELGELARARRFLRPSLDARPVDVIGHRQYQELVDTAEAHAELVATYDAMVAAEPENADLLYLRGRLEPAASDAKQWFQRAVRADAQSAWAQFALGSCEAALGDWRVAVPSLRNACRSQEGALRFRGVLDLALLSAGRHDELERDLSERTRSNPGDLAAWRMLGLNRIATGRADAAFEMADQLEQLLLDKSGLPAEDVQQLMSALRSSLSHARGDLETALELARDDPARARILLDLGRLDEADELLDLEQDPYVWLAMSIAHELAGDAQAAERWRRTAAERLARGDAEGRAVAAALEAADVAAVDALRGLNLLPEHKAVALTAVALRSPERRAELCELALALHRVPGYPRLLLERAAEAE